MEKSDGQRLVKSTDAVSPSSSTLRAKKAKTVRKKSLKSSVSSRRDEPRLVRVPFTARRPRLTAAQKRELDALFALPDDQIDFSDIPEKTEFNSPVYVNLFAPPRRKKSVTIRLDGDVVKWFKGQGKGWQTKMNWVLRLYYASHRKTGVKVGRP